MREDPKKKGGTRENGGKGWVASRFRGFVVLGVSCHGAARLHMPNLSIFTITS